MPSNYICRRCMSLQGASIVVDELKPRVRVCHLCRVSDSVGGDRSVKGRSNYVAFTVELDVFGGEVQDDDIRPENCDDAWKKRTQLKKMVMARWV